MGGDFKSDGNKNLDAKNIALTGLMTAIVFLATYFLKVPFAQGYFTLGDTIVIIAAVILGPVGGFISGSFGSALADIASGYIIFAPFTFIIKGLEAVIVYYVYRKLSKLKSNVLIASIAGTLFMVVGYFLSELLILPLISSNFGFIYALGEIPMNLLQAAVSTAAATLLFVLIKKNLKIR